MWISAIIDFIRNISLSIVEIIAFIINKVDEISVIDNSYLRYGTDNPILPKYYDEFVELPDITFTYLGSPKTITFDNIAFATNETSIRFIYTDGTLKFSVEYDVDIGTFDTPTLDETGDEMEMYEMTKAKFECFNQRWIYVYRGAKTALLDFMLIEDIFVDRVLKTRKAFVVYEQNSVYEGEDRLLIVTLLDSASRIRRFEID
jgi:hypothetical protein